MILAEGKFIKKKSTMTYHRHLFTGNVLTVRLSCEKNFQKKQGKQISKKISKKITVRGKKIKIGYEYIPLPLPSVFFLSSLCIPPLYPLYSFPLPSVFLPSNLCIPTLYPLYSSPLPSVFLPYTLCIPATICFLFVFLLR